MTEQTSYEYSDSYKKIKFSSIPETVAFELLYRCNLRCSYCYIGEKRKNPLLSMPPFELTLQIVQKIYQEGVKKIYLIGGEPFYHHQFEQICKYIAELGFRDRGIVTNSTLITEELAQLLKELGFWFNITFMGPNPEIFDQIAQSKGAFYEALQGLHILRDVGINPVIEYDPLPSNYRHIYDTIKMLLKESIPIQEIWLHRIAPFGYARMREELQLTIEQYREIFYQAKRIKDEFGIDAIFEDGFPLCLIEENLWQYTEPCESGFILATVDPLGNLKRCACQMEHLGNILEVPLHELWQEKLQHFRSLEWFAPICKQCDLLLRCGGGCAISAPGITGYGVDRFSKNFIPIIRHL